MPELPSPVHICNALQMVCDRVRVHSGAGHEGDDRWRADTSFGPDVFAPPPAFTLPQWDEVYRWLKDLGAVEVGQDEFSVDCERLGRLAAAFRRNHDRRLLRNLPAPDKCLAAVQAFERRVGQHGQLPEGTEWRARVPIPADKEGLVLATPELLVDEQGWRAVLHLFDQRGVWVADPGVGFDVDRDALYRLMDDLEADALVEREPRRGTKANPFEEGEFVRTRGARAGAVVEDRDLDFEGPAMYTVKFHRGSRAWLEEGDLEADPDHEPVEDVGRFVVEEKLHGRQE